jgi:predicted restriction endonuclease
LHFARIGQSTFRKNVFIHWNNSCSITECKNPDFLIASHIKPWRDCKENNEWINPINGLLLTPNLDKAFDAGYISFEENGKILISSHLDSEMQKVLGINSGMHLKKVDSAMIPFLEYHRLNIFKR